MASFEGSTESISDKISEISISEPAATSENNEEKLSKNQLKRQQKGLPAKEKKEKVVVPVAAKKESAPKKEKDPVVVPVDSTPKGEKKVLGASDIESFPSAYFPSYVESAWQEW